VFPDEAVLPGGEAGGPAGGAQAGAASAAGAVAAGGAPSAAGSGALAGEPNVGGAPTTMGGAPDSLGGAATGGAPNDCADPSEIIRDATADTWIEKATPGAGHGDDGVLHVVGGAEEQRALVQFSLPMRQAGTSLIRATVRLRLQANADVTLAERHLEMSQLEQQVDSQRATWSNWGNGASRRWQMAGGDFGLALASATIPAEVAGGWVSFDVTAAVEEALSPTSAVPFPLIVLEVGDPPTSPSALAFTSTEGDDSEDPELLIEYCE
jgi:hypothetical protein